RFRANLVGHQVEEPDLHGTDVLAHRRALVHDGHALAHEHVVGGKLIGDPDRHVQGSKKQKPAATVATSPNGSGPDGPLATFFTWLQADRQITTELTIFRMGAPLRQRGSFARGSAGRMPSIPFLERERPNPERPSGPAACAHRSSLGPRR